MLKKTKVFFSHYKTILVFGFVFLSLSFLSILDSVLILEESYMSFLSFFIPSFGRATSMFLSFFFSIRFVHEFFMSKLREHFKNVIGKERGREKTNWLSKFCLLHLRLSLLGLSFIGKNSFFLFLPFSSSIFHVSELFFESLVRKHWNPNI